MADCPAVGRVRGIHDPAYAARSDRRKAAAVSLCCRTVKSRAGIRHLPKWKPPNEARAKREKKQLHEFRSVGVRTESEQKETHTMTAGTAGRKRARTMYMKTFNEYGEPLELTLDGLEVFSTCPCCGAEVPQPDFWETIRNDPDFDPYTTEAYCDRCSSLSTAERHILKKCQSVKSEAEHIGEQLLCGEMTCDEVTQHLRNLGEALR